MQGISNVFSMSDKQKSILLSGNEAVARGAWEAGVLLGTGYPGTPSSEILENLKNYPGVRAQWCVNEKVSLEVAAGASWAGARVLVTMKHVGLNVAADPLFTLAYTGVKGGLVIAVADDPGLHSSQNEQDSRHYARAAKLPMLEPSDSREAIEMVKLGYSISEEFDIPVLLRLTTRVSHSRTIVNPGERKESEMPLAYTKDPKKQVMIPAYGRMRHRSLEERMEKLTRYAEDTPLNRVEEGSGEPGIITSGISYQYCKEVAPDAPYLKLGMVYPLPKESIKNFFRNAGKVFIVEELDPFLETEIKAMGLPVSGKRPEYRLGELNPDRVGGILKGDPESLVVPPAVPLRPPVMCAGCPHRGVFTVLKKLKLFVTGDIGCYTLGALPPLSALDTCLCMGAGVSMSEGFRTVLSEDSRNNVVAVIGDSTFIHSGITSLIDVVYNGNGGVVIILDNSTTAMTGRQDHPATGKNLSGEVTNRVNLEELCRGTGVRRIKVINPYDLAGIESYLRESLGLSEPTVIIARAPCVFLTRGEERHPYRVIADACVACERCLKTGCPALIRLPDGKVEIEEGLCTGCGVCAQVCLVGAIVR